MPAQTRTPRATWIEQGLKALGIGGPDAVRVEALAQALGVTKGGFYWHFDDRSALLAEMLDTWERVVSDDVISVVEADGGHAREKLRRLFDIAVSMEDMVKIEMAIREWSRRDPRVAARLRGLDNRRMDYLRSLFGQLTADEEEVEVRCLQAFSLFIANDYIAAEHGRRSRVDVLELTLNRLMA
ncbi:MAG: hypothetical protein QOI82_2943 [Actinomycetota bacterium]|jgi:AcrR family transcriptional regulator|nr:hypothetical protein [Actinomycetota bacterium]